MELLDGNKLKKKLLDDLRVQVRKEKRQLGLAVIQIGNDYASGVYIKRKEEMAGILEYRYVPVKLEENVSQEEVLLKIEELNNDELIDGILVQMPIPNHLDAKVIQNAIDYQKDVDGLTDINMGKLVHNDECLIACTPAGILELLNYYNIDIEGKNVVIIGRSNLVGKPLFNLMINNNATVTLCHSKTSNLKEIACRADILIVAIGKAKYITSEYVKDGAVVIDTGINWQNSKMCGDVDFDDVKDKVSYITPVPGGVGPMTVAELGNNVYKAYTLKKKKR